MNSKCQDCGKIVPVLYTFRCNEESCNAILCEDCKNTHNHVEFPEPIARSCFDPECDGCWGCIELSKEEFNHG